jgi:hypothetical protein
VSVSGHGRSLWTCTRDFLTGFFVSLVDVSDPDAPTAVGRLHMPVDCGSIAVSDDGKRVYVNTSDGVRFVDAAPLDTGGDPTLSDVFSPTAGVSAGAGHLVLRAADAVRVLRQSDHAEVASVPASGVLAASLAGGRLLLEGFRTVGGGMEGFVALWDVLDATPPAQLDEVILMTTNFVGDPPPSFRSAVTLDGSAVITKIGARLFDLTQGRLRSRPPSGWPRRPAAPPRRRRGGSA